MVEIKQLQLHLDEDFTFRYNLLNLPDRIGQEKWQVVNEVEMEYKKKGFRVASRGELKIILKHRIEEFEEGLNYIYRDIKSVCSPMSFCVYSSPALAEYRHQNDEEQEKRCIGCSCTKTREPSFSIYPEFTLKAGKGRNNPGWMEIHKYLWRKEDRLVMVEPKPDKGNLK